MPPHRDPRRLPRALARLCCSTIPPPTLTPAASASVPHLELAARGAPSAHTSPPACPTSPG
eukprot:4289074-Pleurochrysis_carterae.AAC.1